MSTRWTRKLGVGLAAAIAVAGLAAPSLGDTTRIKAVKKNGDWVWSKDFVSINKGDKVVWRNPSDGAHNVTAYGGNWSKSTVLAPGDTTSKRFRKKGTYKYYCSFHGSVENGQCSGMCGRIRVLASQ